MSGVIDKVRAKCMERGANGIRSIGRIFKQYDDNGSKTLDRQELTTGLKEFGLELSSVEINELFRYMDGDNSGSVNFDEFLKAIRPPMSQSRLKLIDQAFNKIDKTGDGRLTVQDLKNVYDVRNHPKAGEWSEDRILQEFLNNFQGDNDDVVTKQEWIDYYAGVSASIDDDEYFEYMMRQVWHL